MKVKLDKELLYRYSIKEDIVNAVTHGIGFILAYIGMIVLVYMTTNKTMAIGVTIYGITMQMMFMSSTLYHAIFHDATRSILKRIDHSMIFIFILGTYLPLTIFLNSTKAYILFSILVFLTITGILLKIFLIGKYKKLFTLIYILMGWIAILEIVDLYFQLPTLSFVFLVLGGVVYTIGALFYALTNFKYHHAIWHVFVMLAALCHYITIYLIV